LDYRQELFAVISGSSEVLFTLRFLRLFFSILRKFTGDTVPRTLCLCFN